MLTDHQIATVLNAEFANFLENIYEPRVPTYYADAIEKAIAFDEYFSTLRDWEISDFFYNENNDKELTIDEVKYIRACVTDGTNEYLRQNAKSIVALPQVAKIIFGA